MTDKDKVAEQEMWKEAMKGYADRYRYQERKAANMIFRKSCLDDQFKELRRYEKPFYWLKTLICLKMKWLNGSYMNGSICVATWDHKTYATQDGTQYSWWAVWCEMGLFKNWKVQVATDGT